MPSTLISEDIVWTIWKHIEDKIKSLSITKLADVIGLLYRDGYYKAREEGIQIKNDVLEVDIQKNRNGRLGRLDFDYDLETQELIQKYNG